MQRQCLHHVFGSRWQIVGVYVEDARTGTIRSAHKILRGGHRFGPKGFNFLNNIVGRRFSVENTVQRRIDFVAQIVVLANKLFCTVEIILRVGAQMLKERLHITIETNLVFYPLHFQKHALRLALANVVNLLRRVIRGRGFAHFERVVLGPTRNLVLPNRLASVLHVFVFYVVMQLGVSRRQYVVDVITVSRLYTRTLLVRERVRHVRDRPPKITLFRFVDDLGGKLRQCLFHQNSRSHNAELDAFTHPRN